MENRDNRPELMRIIDMMYVVSVFWGRYTKPGSFIAVNEVGKEFFASKQLVQNKPELFKMLSERIKPLWVLVKDEIWGRKWNNKSVSEIVAISESKEDCENYKANLIQRVQIKYNLYELHERYFKLIENPSSLLLLKEEEYKLLREISVLEDKLSELNNQLNY